jgi:hypothetical protein
MYIRTHRDLSHALSVHEELRASRLKVFGPRHPLTLRVTQELAEICGDMSNWDQARYRV